jgi:acyl carrier protein
MEHQETFNKVMTIIKPFVRNEAALTSASPQTRILEDLGVNSARLVDIVLSFEDEFGIEIDDASADRVRTLGDAVSVISSKANH